GPRSAGDAVQPGVERGLLAAAHRHDLLELAEPADVDRDRVAALVDLGHGQLAVDQLAALLVVDVHRAAADRGAAVAARLADPRRVAARPGADQLAEQPPRHARHAAAAR